MEILLGILVVVGVTAVVVYPLWRPAPEPPPDPVGPAARLQALEQRKASLYEGIRDLGFDYRTDKLLEDDYQEEVGRLKAEAAEVLREIDELRSAPPRGPDEIEREIERIRTRLEDDAPDRPEGPAEAAARKATEAGEGQGGPFCTRCGRQAAAGDRFCAACGEPLREPS